MAVLPTIKKAESYQSKTLSGSELPKSLDFYIEYQSTESVQCLGVKRVLLYDDEAALGSHNPSFCTHHLFESVRILRI